MDIPELPRTSDMAGRDTVPQRPRTVLLTGSTGFIGSRLVTALLARGHRVVCAVRHRAQSHHAGGASACAEWIAVDFTRDHDAAAWLPRLSGVDVVVNAVGILRESGSQSFDALHVAAPRALFAACVEAGVRRVVQLSALGADEAAASRYHRSKREADEFLLSQPLSAAVAQPSLVFGAGGASAHLFSTWACAPVLPLPGRGDQRVQPIHVDDVIAALCRLVEGDMRGRIALVGPEPMTLRTFLARLRAALQCGRAWFIPVPMSLMRAVASAGTRFHRGLLDSDTLAMLERGNTGDATATRALLGREPRLVEQFIGPSDRQAATREAKLGWLMPLLRASIAIVWLVTGVVSFGLYPVEDSYELLARVGISGALAPVLLYGAAGLDIAFGIATLVLRRRRALWLAQIAVILGYTAIITWRLPEFWLHPYGPILKNLPLIAALWLLYETER
jgi:uncharacterized protein YbjT (DUF2867 family)